MTRTGRPKVEWITVPCAGCGAPQERRKSDMARNRTGRVFCSTTCRNKVGSRPRRKEDKTCEQCGKVFYPLSGGVKGANRFCSKACHDAAQRKDRVSKVCEVCGKTFELKPSQVRTMTGRFCSALCESTSRIRRPLNRTYNGRPALLTEHGYVRVYEPNHPKASSGGWVLEHRLVIERAIGRLLTTDEQVHHIDGDKTNNSLDNLQVIGASDHSALTNALTQARIQRDRAELERYRKLYGPLPPEEE